MCISRRARTLPLALVGSLPLLLALSLHGQPAPPPSAFVPATPRQVADALDKIVQPRFQDVSAGRFGMTRLMPVASGHEGVGFVGKFRTENTEEARLLAQADASQRDYAISFLRCAHVPGKFGDGETHMPAGMNRAIVPHLWTLVFKEADRPAGLTPNYQHVTEPLLSSAAIEALPKTSKGHQAQASVEGWTLFLRPVRASQASCLTCHVGTKRGDTLGVMVYAVGNTVNKN